MKQLNAKWTPMACRFSPLFDPDYEHDTVAIMDVHDVLRQQFTSLKKALFSKDSFLLTYYPAKGPPGDCIYANPLQLGRHIHLDAGFSVWKPHPLRIEIRNANGDFMDYLSALCKRYHELPRGSDEVILEQYITSDFLQLIAKHAELALHRHRLANATVSTAVVEEAAVMVREIYCLCRKPNDPSKPMVRCDTCHDWLHLECVQMTQAEADRARRYICPRCINVPVVASFVCTGELSFWIEPQRRPRTQ